VTDDGGEDDKTCVSFGCDREAPNDEHCEPCKTAFEAGYHKAQEDESGLRGRQEIQEAIEDRIEFLEEDLEGWKTRKPYSTDDLVAVNQQKGRKRELENVLDLVLGEDGDL